MAHTFNTQVLVDNKRKTIIKYVVVGDGASGDLTKAIVFDASAYTPAVTYNALEYIDATMVGASGLLFWDDAVTEIPLLGIPADHQLTYDVRTAGTPPLFNNAVVASRTGDILITTNGFGALTDMITIIVSVIKKSA